MCEWTRICAAIVFLIMLVGVASFICPFVAFIRFHFFQRLQPRFMPYASISKYGLTSLSNDRYNQNALTGPSGL